MKARILQVLDKTLPESLIQQAIRENPFFTEPDIRYAWEAIRSWAGEIGEFQSNRLFNNKQRVGIVAAGNIPFAGMHDLLCVCLSGFLPVFRPSSKDRVLMKWALDGLGLTVANQSELFNARALLASGSTLTTLQLDSLFLNVPRLLRGHRYSVAVLPSDFSPAEAGSLAEDILRYNGLGCRSVSNIVVPNQATAIRFLDALKRISWEMSEGYRQVLLWERAISLVNQIDIDTELPVLPVYHASVRTVTPVYLAIVLEPTALPYDDLQVVVSRDGSVRFGETQRPGFYDFPDGKDVFCWLSHLDQESA